MTKETVIDILLSLGGVAAAGAGLFFYAVQRAKEAAVDAIRDAEEQAAEGEQKMQMAVKAVYGALPPVLRGFLTEDRVRILIQCVFDKMLAFARQRFGGKS